MNLKDLFTPSHIRLPYAYFPVETAGTEDGRIQYIHTVGGCHDYDSFIETKTVHLHKELVQRLLPLIMSAAHSCSPAPCNSIDLIDKDNTGSILLGLLKEVTDSGRADTYTHLYKIRT